MAIIDTFEWSMFIRFLACIHTVKGEYMGPFPQLMFSDNSKSNGIHFFGILYDHTTAILV